MFGFGLSPFTPKRPCSRGGSWEQSSEGTTKGPPVKRTGEGERMRSDAEGSEAESDLKTRQIYSTPISAPGARLA